MEGSVSALGLNSVESNRCLGLPPDELSPEDIAWADSCIMKDEISENGWNSWNSLKGALIGTLGAECDSSAARWEEFSSSPREIGTTRILDARVAGVLLSDEEPDKFSADLLINENNDISSSRFNLKNVFLPTYNENLRDWGTIESEELEVSDLVTEQSIGDIFKVWNLDIPAEEDEFIKQLDRAFSESSLELTPSVSDDSKLLKGLEDVSIDDIISGVADLSLNHISVIE